jgi:hypothetical protein
VELKEEDGGDHREQKSRKDPDQTNSWKFDDRHGEGGENADPAADKKIADSFPEKLPVFSELGRKSDLGIVLSHRLSRVVPWKGHEATRCPPERQTFFDEQGWIGSVPGVRREGGVSLLASGSIVGRTFGRCNEGSERRKKGVPGDTSSGPARILGVVFVFPLL